MHIKRRGNRAMLYRSSWVPKGANGNTHGYSIQAFVASIPIDAESLPADFPDQLTVQELEYIEAKIFEPARLASQQKRRAVDAREADPMWRLDDAVRLIHEAAERSERAVVPNSKVAAVQSAVNKVRTISQHQASVPEQSSSDPLRDALNAVKRARDAVVTGKYGKAPVEGIRATHPYKLWAEIYENVNGSDGNSLLSTLQARGFVKTRQK